MDGMGGLGDMMKMVQQAQEQAAQMQQDMQRKLAEQSIEGSAGGGMVKVVMNGCLELRSIDIDPEVIDKDEKEMLEDLITAAVSQAIKKAKAQEAEAQQGQLGNLTQGLGGMGGPGGMDLSKLFGGGA